MPSKASSSRCPRFPIDDANLFDDDLRALFVLVQKANDVPYGWERSITQRRCVLFGGWLVLQSPPVQQSMSGRISTKVTFPKHAHYVTDYGSIVKKII